MSFKTVAKTENASSFHSPVWSLKKQHLEIKNKSESSQNELFVALKRNKGVEDASFTVQIDQQ